MSHSISQNQRRIYYYLLKIEYKILWFILKLFSTILRNPYTFWWWSKCVMSHELWLLSKTKLFWQQLAPDQSQKKLRRIALIKSWWCQKTRIMRGEKNLVTLAHDLVKIQFVSAIGMDDLTGFKPAIGKFLTIIEFITSIPPPST